MDKDTRNAVERATQRARKLLEDDFASQLEGTFDVQRDGRVPPKPGSHLSPRQVFQRDKIVAAIEHKRATGMTAAEAVADYIHDAAFTTVNRFVALKMLEARELVQECISKGEQSSGYREFCGLAPGVALLPDSAGYRIFLESLFDELSTEVKVLFDRRDPASVLWPKRATFEALLEVLNATDLFGVWGEDETIGWVYQFFNSGDERKRMREESQAPRNSRELAVRNQFFTPRYVVEFLVDNTLGRTWLEMHGEGSGLAERCRYFVRSEEERTRARPRKDPRDLRVLDPACGSGHFLLYCFDLLLTIYEEAWAAEASNVRCHATGRTLRDDYPDLVSLRRATPMLILEHNLHGVDIDPRATQIAALALWLRAQRAWKDVRVPATERPPVRRAHLVVAEPMPGDTALVEEFAARLDPPLLRDLFRKMVSEMRLAGELGTLIPVEEGIAAELRRAREQFVKQRKTTGFLPGMEPARRQGELDLSGIDDDGFFHAAEARIVDALRLFAEAAANGATVRRRLFAGDAAQGIALIDLLRTRFDVVLMNPPFGEAIESHFKTLERQYPRSKRDLATAFVDRGLALLAPRGALGVLLSRKLFFVDTQSEWRRHILGSYTLSPCADLGHRVLDGALVEVAAAVVQRPNEGQEVADAEFISCLAAEDKAGLLREVVRDRESDAVYRCSASSFLSLPSAQFAYNTPPRLLRAFERLPSLEPGVACVRMGLTTSDNERFLRLAWEFPYSCAESEWRSRWVRLAKGGEYVPFYSDNELLVKYGDGSGELAAFGLSVGNEAQSRRSSKFYGRPALTYTERTASRFSVRCLPKSSIFSMAGPAIVVEDETLLLPCLGILNSNAFNALYELCLGGGDSVSSGSAARHYTTGFLGKMPFATPDELRRVPPEPVARIVHLLQESCAADETDVRFAGLPSLGGGTTVRAFIDLQAKASEDRLLEMVGLGKEIELASRRALSLEDAADDLASVVGRHSSEYGDRSLSKVECEEAKKLFELDVNEVVDRVAEHLGFPRHITAKSYLVDRRYELIAHRFAAHPRTVVAVRRELGIRPHGVAKEWLERLVSLAVGIAFGRWRDDGPCRWESGAFDPVPGVPPYAARGDGVPSLVSIEGHPLDLAARVEGAIERMLGVGAGSSRRELDELAAELGARSFRSWFDNTFFETHVSKYSRHRRVAPVYWRLGPAEFPCWLNFHAATSDTLFKIASEIVAPELRILESRLEVTERSLSSEIMPTRERTLLRARVDGIRAFATELRMMAPLWSPHHEDGALLCAAPLWRLFGAARNWQKLAREEWELLRDEKREWAHVAMHLWPERVVPKCSIDRSLAIAHGLEDVFWIEGTDGKWGPRSTPTRSVEEIVRERTSPAIKAALKSLLDGPVAASNGRRRGRRSGTAAATGGNA